MAQKPKKKSAAKAPKARKPVKKVAKKQQATTTSSAVQGPLAPLNDRVVVRHLTDAEAGTANAFGIIIPDTVSKEKPEQGVVVAVGPGKWSDDAAVRIPMTVTVGDRVVFSKYGYDEVKVGGTEYYIVAEANILAVING